MPQLTIGEALLFQVLLGKSTSRLKTDRKNRDWNFIAGVMGKIDQLTGAARFKDKCKRSLRNTIKTDPTTHLTLLASAIQVLNFQINPKDLVSSMLLVAEAASVDSDLNWERVLTHYVTLDPLCRTNELTAKVLESLWEKLVEQPIPKDEKEQQIQKKGEEESLSDVTFFEPERKSPEPRSDKVLEACIEISKLHLREMHNYAAIHSANEPGGHWKLWTKKKKRLELFNASKVVVAATSKGKVIGFAACKENAKSLSVLDIHVIDPYRRSGIGTQLFLSCVSPFQSKYENIVVHVLSDNVPGKRFFRALGFSFPIVHKDNIQMKTVLDNATTALQQKRNPDALGMEQNDSESILQDELISMLMPSEMDVLPSHLRSSQEKGLFQLGSPLHQLLHEHPEVRSSTSSSSSSSAIGGHINQQPTQSTQQSSGNERKEGSNHQQNHYDSVRHLLHQQQQSPNGPTSLQQQQQQQQQQNSQQKKQRSQGSDLFSDDDEPLMQSKAEPSSPERIFPMTHESESFDSQRDSHHRSSYGMLDDSVQDHGEGLVHARYSHDDEGEGSFDQNYGMVTDDIFLDGSNSSVDGFSQSSRAQRDPLLQTAGHMHTHHHVPQLMNPTGPIDHTLLEQRPGKRTRIL